MEIGVAHHQVDIFLLDVTGASLGRLCPFNQCPKHKLQCRAEGPPGALSSVGPSSARARQRAPADTGWNQRRICDLALMYI